MEDFEKEKQRAKRADNPFFITMEGKNAVNIHILSLVNSTPDEWGNPTMEAF